MRNKRLIWCALLAMAGCAPSLQVYTHTARNASFKGLHTFAIGSAEEAPRGYRRGSVASKVISVVAADVESELTAKGLEQVSIESSDLVVRLGVGQRHKEETPLQQTDSTGDQVTVVDPDGPFNYTEQELVIDVFQGRTNHRLWHGAAREIIEPGEVDDAALNHAVRRLLVDFPG